MLRNRSYRGAQHRILKFMYLNYIILALTPTISAPLERGFNQGQPEMHQAMDNMVAHEDLVKKAGKNFPGADDTSYHVLLTPKTSNLLDEAEHILSTLKISKEKHWVEALVQRMKEVAELLEKTAEKSKQHLPENQNSVNGVSVPEVLLSQPTKTAVTAVTAVPGSDPIQKSSKMMSKFPVTSPELSQVLPANENPSESQDFTKPATLSNQLNVDEDDELVRELESLHKEAAVVVPVQNFVTDDDMTPTFTTPLTPEILDEPEGMPKIAKKDVAKLKTKLLSDIAEFVRLGKIPNDVAEDLNEEITDGDNTPSKSEETKRSEASDTGKADKTATNRLVDMEKEDEKISKVNTKSLELQKNTSNQGGKQFQSMKVNYPYMPSFPKFGNYPHMPPQSNRQPYQRDFGYGAGNFLRPNPFNFHGNYQAISSTNQKFSQISDALRQRMPRPQGMVHNGYSGNTNYNEYLHKNRYVMYPHMQYWQNKNSTLDISTSPYLTNPSVNHQIDTQLSDEMKRQLKDGKIVVLSDSVVRTNFKSDEAINNKDKTTIQPNIIDDKKDGTKPPN